VLARILGSEGSIAERADFSEVFRELVSEIPSILKVNCCKS
jgi:hypothetical protein